MVDYDKLIKYWDKHFKYESDYSEYSDYDNIDLLFNSYLLKHSAGANNLINEVCYCRKVGNDYHIYFVDNNKIKNEIFNVRAKRKLFNLINNHNVIIIDGFSLSEDLVDKNKILIRYELLRNIATSDHTHFFSDTLPYSIDDTTVFFTEEFYIELNRDKVRLNQLRFTSYILNMFEKGVAVDEITLKPNINISKYGRWYWSSTEKIQNDTKARNRVYNKLLKYGKVMTIDLVNGEPWILSQLSGSKIMKKLVRQRIKLTNKGEIELGDKLKNLLNIYIHAVNSPSLAYNIFKSKNDSGDIKILEKLLGSNILDILNTVENELTDYNKSVIKSYKDNLSVVEFGRRIVNPATILNNNKDIIKEHRIFLQGHTHDRILLMAQGLYSSLGIIPMFTVHDSVSYFIDNKQDENEILECVNKVTKNIKTPITIEMIS